MKPHFLLRDMGEDLRKRLEVDAFTSDLPMAEVIRSILCEHYSLDCTPKRGRIRSDQWTHSTRVLLKLQPELFAAIKEDAAVTGETMRTLILAALEGHYQQAVTS